MNKNELENVLKAGLSAGDDEVQIVKFFESQNWVYSYDRFNKRFQAREEELKSEGVTHQIYIYVDENKHFLRFEVVAIVNAPPIK